MSTKEIFEKSALFGNTLRHGFHFKLNSIFNVWGCSGRFHMNNTNTSISKAQAFLLSFEIGGSLDVSDVEGDLRFNFPMPSEGKWLNAISYTHVQNKKIRFHINPKISKQAAAIGPPENARFWEGFRTKCKPCWDVFKLFLTVFASI